MTHGFLRDSATGITQYEAGNREWIFLEVDAKIILITLELIANAYMCKECDKSFYGKEQYMVGTKTFSMFSLYWHSVLQLPKVYYKDTFGFNKKLPLKVVCELILSRVISNLIDELSKE